MAARTDTWVEAWWCDYHDDIHLGTAADWTDDHRADMTPMHVRRR